MLHRIQQTVKTRPMARRNSVVAARTVKTHMPAAGKRAAGGDSRRSGVIMPPEQWHEPVETWEASDYRIIEESAGVGYRHVLGRDEIRERLSRFPQAFLRNLQVVHLSRMTRKKKSCPCYGMQWGSTIYLYPIEENRIETFSRPPRPAQVIEARMYGGRWVQRGREWQLVWSEEAIRDYYLNNILVHELGHLVDDRNTGYQDRERYAEWFAIAHGYRPTRAAYQPKKVTRRHG
jgi:hypothetical protein